MIINKVLPACQDYFIGSNIIQGSATIESVSALSLIIA